MRRFLIPVLLAIAAGCTVTSSRGPTSLAAEVDVKPLRGQSVEVLKQNDPADSVDYQPDPRVESIWKK